MHKTAAFPSLIIYRISVMHLYKVNLFCFSNDSYALKAKNMCGINMITVSVMPCVQS